MVRHLGQRSTIAYRRWTNTLQESEPSPVVGINRTVGFLTYPNSGTSWVIMLVSRLTKTAPFSVYAKEQRIAQEAHGLPVIELPTLNHGERELPLYQISRQHDAIFSRASVGENETILVKDHGCFYSYSARCDTKDCQRQNCLRKRIDSYDGMVRLIRNPYDNMVARYHLGCWNHNKDCSVEGLEKRNGLFIDYFKNDLTNYILEHCSFSQVAETMPSLTVVYENLLTIPLHEVKRILRFMGRGDIPDEVIEKEIKAHGPDQAKVDAVINGVPEHLTEYSNEDIDFIESNTHQYLYEGCKPYSSW